MGGIVYRLTRARVGPGCIREAPDEDSGRDPRDSIRELLQCIPTAVEHSSVVAQALGTETFGHRAVSTQATADLALQ